MEKRLSVIAIFIARHDVVNKLNHILSEFSEAILARQGLPLKDRGMNVISLIMEDSTDRIGALTGRIGKLDGVQVKSILSKIPEGNHDRDSKDLFPDPI